MRNNKMNIPCCLASLLLVLVMITTYMTSGLYARYTNTGSGSDEARVIKFMDIAIRDANSLIITPGVNCVRDVAVEFEGSEAVTYIFIEIDASNHWEGANDYSELVVGDWIKMAIDTARWTYLTTNTSNGNFVYYYKGEGTVNGVLQPNKFVSFEDANVIIDDVITVSNQLTMYDFDELNGLSLKFTATAVQANGFDDVDDAWDSIEAKGL